MSDVISPPRSKQKPVYVFLNYLVNMTMDSNLIPAAERTLLVLQITNQAAAAGRTPIFECFHDFFYFFFLKRKSEAFTKERWSRSGTWRSL